MGYSQAGGWPRFICHLLVGSLQKLLFEYPAGICTVKMTLVYPLENNQSVCCESRKLLEMGCQRRDHCGMMEADRRVWASKTELGPARRLVSVARQEGPCRAWLRPMMVRQQSNSILHGLPNSHAGARLAPGGRRAGAWDLRRGRQGSEAVWSWQDAGRTEHSGSHFSRALRRWAGLGPLLPGQAPSGTGGALSVSLGSWAQPQVGSRD